MEEEWNDEELIRMVFESVFYRRDWAGDPHLEKTPARFLKALRELGNAEEYAWEFTTFVTESDEMVVVQDIPFYTFCAHHILPFFGVAHVAYIPQRKLCGLSKIARTVRDYAADLNVQEELTINIADYLESQLAPLGVAVIMEAEHLCMTMRGVKVPGSKTTTSAMRGVFLDPDKGARAEFLQLIKS